MGSFYMLYNPKEDECINIYKENDPESDPQICKNVTFDCYY